MKKLTLCIAANETELLPYHTLTQNGPEYSGKKKFSQCDQLSNMWVDVIFYTFRYTDT